MAQGEPPVPASAPVMRRSSGEVRLAAGWRVAPGEEARDAESVGDGKLEATSSLLEQPVSWMEVAPPSVAAADLTRQMRLEEAVGRRRAQLYDSRSSSKERPSNRQSCSEV